MIIKAITFDFWSTLYHFKQSARSLRAEYLRGVLLATGHRDIKGEQVAGAAKKAWEAWSSIWHGEQRTPQASEWLGFFLVHAGAALPEIVAHQVAVGLEEIGVSAALPVDGVAEVLPRLASRYKLGLISDTGVEPGRVLRSLLERDGLLSHFSHITFSDELGRSKPHPNAFLATLTGLQVAPGEAVHVGDLRRTDVAGARGVGMHTVRYAGVHDDRKPEYPEAEVVIRSYAELESWIEEWGRGD